MKAVLGALLALIMACNSPVFPVVSKVVQTVVADITAGDTAEQVEADVARYLAGQPGVDIVVIVNDAIAIAIDLGLIPAGVLPQARAMLATEHAKLATRGAK